MVRKVLRVMLWVLLLLVALFAIQTIRHWDTIQRVFLGGLKVYETVPPKLPADIKRPAILVFSKTNGYRHEEAIPVANAMFAELAKERGWGYFQTENGATFSPEILARFDAVVFNNASGDVFTPQQREAIKAFIENGGGFVGIHAAGDDSHKAWPWYVNQIIGAKFIGHPLNPQFQAATVHVERHDHPATAKLGDALQRTDEWYSFDHSPRATKGVTVLVTLDEGTYSPKGLFGKDLAMGDDHPIVWWRCVGKGRALYSAMGHTAGSFREPEYRQLLAGALDWALRIEGSGCNTSPVLAAPARAK